MCFGCGLSNVEDSCTLSSTLLPRQCDYSRKNLQLARQVVTEGEAKLADLGDTIERLRRHQQALRSTIAQYQTLLSPISRLPDDILLHISAKLVGARRGHTDWLWSIAATCRQWRSTALSYSPLWANIRLNLNSNASLPALISQCSRAETQILRVSPPIPISCTLNISNEDHIQRFLRDHFLSKMEDTIRCLVEEMHQCHQIDVSGDGHED